ncbi:MAG: hypothetical protein WBP11_09555 [Dokdonella sp.]
MSNNAKGGFLLVGIVVIAALVFWWLRAPPEMANQASVAVSPAEKVTASPVAAPTTSDVRMSTPSSKMGIERSTPMKQPAKQGAAEAREARPPAGAEPASLPPAFKVESRFLDATGLGIDFTKGPGVLSNGSLDIQMEALAAQASGEPLAADLTELYSNTANEAAKSADGVVVRRIVCGLRVCLGSAISASSEELQKWNQSFISQQTVRGNSAVGVNLKQPDGTSEFRVVFATDPAGVYAAPRK